jgi:hypothetical protein
LAKLGNCEELSTLAAAYIPVLAENTSEITAGKEYCARAIFACYARFFAEVGGGPCNTGEKGTSAYSGGIGFSSLCTAFSRTKAAF